MYAMTQQEANNVMIIYNSGHELDSKIVAINRRFYRLI